MVVDLKKYKAEKKLDIYLNHIEAILYVIRIAYKSFKPFEAYIPVKNIIVTLEQEALVLEAHKAKLKKAKDIKDKG